MEYTVAFDSRHASEKERTFYAKVMIGYWFNELVPGLDDRVAAFVDVLHAGRWFGGRREVRLSAQDARVTTDYHAYRAGSYKDEGEAADVLVLDTASSTMVAIEAKVHSDFKYKKDITENAERIRHVARSLKISSAVQCLLITQAKRDEAEKHQRQSGSHWTRLTKHDGPEPVVLITWEDLLAHNAVDTRVRDFARWKLRQG